MKIAYLMHSDRKYDEVVETINQLTKQGDHVFIMINDDDLREQVQFVYMIIPEYIFPTHRNSLRKAICQWQGVH